MGKDSVVHELRVLQGLSRRREHEEMRSAGSFAVPDDLAEDGFRTVVLLADEVESLERASELLLADLRFEYLNKRDADGALRRFVVLTMKERSTDQVSDFVKRHGRDVQSVLCCFPISCLSATEEIVIGDTRIVPPTLAPLAGPPFEGITEAVTAVAVVEAEGTDARKMAARAGVVATYSLRLMRAALRDERWLADEQLRFRLDDAYWFERGGTGWRSRSDAGWGLEIGAGEAMRLSVAPVVGLPREGGTRLEKQMRLSLEWFERAQLATEPIIATLYLFFALEAILSDKQDRLKAGNLAVRRAVLGSEMTGGFQHPARLYGLYDEVRSAAVHGEEIPDVDAKVVRSFAWDVCLAINEYMSFAKAHGCTKRSQLFALLDASPSRGRIVTGLKQQDQAFWSELEM